MTKEAIIKKTIQVINKYSPIPIAPTGRRFSYR